MLDILNQKLGLLSVTRIGRELIKSLGRKGMIEKVISTGDNSTIIKSMPKYQKFIKDNFDVTLGLYRTKTNIQGTHKRFKAGEWISQRDVASVLDKHFDELKQFSPSTDDGELYILAGTVVGMIGDNFERIKESKNTISEITGTVKVLSNEFGGNDDKQFLRVIWGLSLNELQDLLSASEKDLKVVKSFSKGTLGVINRRDALIILNRIKLIKEVISYKRKNPDFVPDFMKESKLANTMKKSKFKKIIIEEVDSFIKERIGWMR